MFSSFFVERPIFACVISLIIVFAGLVALRFLPLEEYPAIDPPIISVTATYPGANAKTIAANVATILEREVNGIEKMIYMSSESSSSGVMNLNVFFEIGTDVDMAQINVQNRVNAAIPHLPYEVQRSGVTVKKQATGFLMILAISSLEGRYNDVFTSNYASLNIIDELLRVDGVSEASFFGAREYSMRLWLMPDLMAQLQITLEDILSAVREQNADYAIGQIGQPPTSSPVQLTLPVLTEGRLALPQEFENIILRSNLDGSKVLLKDVARVELGAQNYDVVANLNGQPTTLIAVHQQIGSNAIDVANKVKATMERISKNFPAGLTYTIPYDTTQYIKSSIFGVITTIFEAALLVVAIVFLFLQNMRATLVPLLAMVVSIIGTFAGLYILGFSLNTLTLFGLILAVGIVVDDAIVVIENVERNIREFSLSPKEATKKAMSEVTGPVIAIVCVLCAVFIPTAFLGGTAGQLYKQFAITISVSVLISGIVALTLSPALAAYLLKPHTKESKFSMKFNQGFEALTNYYMRCTTWLINHTVISTAIFATLCLILGLLFYKVPSGYLPQEDQGWILVAEKLPNGSSLRRTAEVTNEVYKISREEPTVENVVDVAGFSFLGGPNSNVGISFITFKDWSERHGKDLHVSAILQRLQGEYSKIRNAVIMAFNPSGGSLGGLEFSIQNRSEMGIDAFEDYVNKFVETARQRPELSMLFSSFDTKNMQLTISLDKDKAKALGISIADAFQTLNAMLGSVYVNDFNMYGRVFKVIAQAEPDYRARISDIDEIFVRSATGIMVPLKSIMTIRYTKGPATINRFNGFLAAPFNGDVAPGYSSGQAMAAIQEVAKQVLHSDMTIAWSGRSYQESTTSGAAAQMLAAGLVMVFLILAALYEKWSLPLAVILTVPFGIFGAILAIWLMGISNDVYFQIGLITLVALAAKNAILIVEFALQKRAEGASIIDSALKAAQLRFRAILMTSLTFIFGVAPLVFSSGAGAASRQSVGTGVMGGMIAATLFAVLLVPFFYKVILQISDPKKEVVPSKKAT
jgi:hydrophobe/amphiphile efflux-1 (HAE1) family protein